ncbi:hypothetical protein XNA1_4820001 [Xenorhabdus nematophila str. Anatoliense]|nr:hypothetical protein XNA1_4820001 [Xenorhabdus nematophila str. Anatoliense]
MLYQLSYSRVADGYCIAKDTLNGECQTLVNPMTNKDNSLRLPIKNARHYEHVQIKWQVLYLNLHAKRSKDILLILMQKAHSYSQQQTKIAEHHKKKH